MVLEDNNQFLAQDFIDFFSPREFAVRDHFQFLLALEIRHDTYHNNIIWLREDRDDRGDRDIMDVTDFYSSSIIEDIDNSLRNLGLGISVANIDNSDILAQFFDRYRQRINNVAQSQIENNDVAMAMDVDDSDRESSSDSDSESESESEIDNGFESEISDMESEEQDGEINIRSHQNLRDNFDRHR